jgi:hypothetical protein
VPGLGYTLVLSLPGAFAAALWTIPLAIGGTPGAWLTGWLRRRGLSGLAALGLGLTTLGQLYVALIFTAFIVRASSHHLAAVHGPGRWLAWTVGSLIAVAPPLVALLDWARDPGRQIQHSAVRATWVLTALGFVLFLSRPDLLRLGWGWVPQL